MWGVNYNGTHRRIVAAKTKASAARLMDVTDRHLRIYGCETRNAKELEIALAEPNVVFEKSERVGDAPYVRVA